MNQEAHELAGVLGSPFLSVSEGRGSSLGEFLDYKLRLRLNNKTCIRTHSQGIDWVGYRVWPTHIKVRKSTVRRMKARLKYLQGLYVIGEAYWEEVNASVQSYLGLLKHCNSYNLREKLFGNLVWPRDSAHPLQEEILYLYG